MSYLINSSIVNGRVTAISTHEAPIKYKTSGGKILTYVPYIEYKVNNKVFYYSDKDEFDLVHYQIGENVKIIHKKDDPYESKIFSFPGSWVTFRDLIQFALLWILLFGVFDLILKNQKEGV